MAEVSSCINLRKRTSAFSRTELDAARLLIQLYRDHHKKRCSDANSKWNYEEEEKAEPINDDIDDGRSSAASPSTTVAFGEEEDGGSGEHLDLIGRRSRKRRFRSVLSLYGSAGRSIGRSGKKMKCSQVYSIL